MEEIKFSPLLLNKLDNLIKTLYKEEYFGFLESSEEYVNNLIDFIYTIPSLKHSVNIKKGTEHFIVNTNIIVKLHGILLLILMTLVLL